MAVPECSGALLAPAWWPWAGAPGAEEGPRVGAVFRITVKFLGGCRGGPRRGGVVGGGSARGEEAFPGLGEPPRVRAQPPAPAAKVEFTPSRAGPDFFVFRLFIIAVKLFPSFLADAAAYFF